MQVCISRGYEVGVGGRGWLVELGVLSSGQWVLLTTAQAERRGVSRVQVSRAAADGLLRRVGQGVYQDAGAPEGVFTPVQAAWLASDPARTAEERLSDPVAGVVVGGATAAYLHGVGDLQPEPVELFVATGRRTTRRGVRYRRKAVPVEQVTIAAGLPVTSVARTVSDLVADHVEISLVAGVLGDAVRQRRVELSAIAAVLDADVFTALVTTAGLYPPVEEQTVTALAEVIAGTLGPDSLSHLTQELTQMVSMAVAREVAASVDFTRLRDRLGEAGRFRLPAGFLDDVRRQVAAVSTPAITTVLSRTVLSRTSSRQGPVESAVTPAREDQ